MRVFIALLAVVLVAQPSLAQPLAPSKPAGVKQARVNSNREAIMLGTGAAIMLAVGIVVSGGTSSGPNTGIEIQSQVVVAPSTTG
jgi:hypothetical protein